ncbi:MAG TPA: ABC transporter permease [Candidatus Dormibacteraeota bacterium]|nr:ABC transporter permease [Candidatus Dormibacteraeota bacterium]
MSAAASADVAPLGRMLVTQTRFQLLTRLRIPAFSVLSLGLPVMFYALFNAIYGSTKLNGVTGSEFILVSYATYAVANVMVFNFGMGIANERGRKLDLLQRAMPLPPVVAAVAQVVAAMLFALIALLILFAYAFLVGGVRLGAGTWLDLLWRLIIGAFPMIGLGMAIGYGVGANTAPAVVNAVYLPMAFLSGIFFPLRLMPDFLQKIGQTLPTYHYAELGWNVLGPGVADESAVRALLWLAGWAVVLIGLAVRIYRLDESRKFS